MDVTNHKSQIAYITKVYGNSDPWCYLKKKI